MKKNLFIKNFAFFAASREINCLFDLSEDAKKKNPDDRLQFV